MYPIAEQLAWNPVLPAAMVAVSACVVAWAWAMARWNQGLPVTPYQPRRPAPWRALDLMLIVVFYLAAQYVAMALAGAISGPTSSQAPAGDESTVDHVVAQLVAESNVWVLLLCLVTTAVVTPVAEEFFFRVLVQGWLEARERRWRRTAALRRLMPRGVGPIVLVSLLFAGMHFRTARPQIDAEFFVVFLAADAVARLLTLWFAVEFLRWRVGATAADLGWTPGKLLGDVKLGLAAFAAVAAPVYAMQMALRFLLRDCAIAPDPLPLFFLALALGALYYRTHRIMPVIVLHAALNGASLALLWMGSQ